MRGGVQLPQRAGFETLPAARRGGRAGLGQRVRQAMCQRPAPDGSRIQGYVQAAERFRGGQAARRRWLGSQQFAQQRFNPRRPVRRMIATGSSRLPVLAIGSSAQVVGVEFVEPGATQPEFFGGGGRRKFCPAKGGQHLAD